MENMRPLPTTAPAVERKPTPHADALLRRLIAETTPEDWTHRLAVDLLADR